MCIMSAIRPRMLSIPGRAVRNVSTNERSPGLVFRSLNSRKKRTVRNTVTKPALSSPAAYSTTSSNTPITVTVKSSLCHPLRQ